MTIHPVIKIVNFMIVALLLARAQFLHLAAFLLGIALAYRFCSVSYTIVLHMLRRLRWFFVSIVVLYFWYTPGDPLVDQATLAAWLPTAQGMAEGMMRISALILLVAAVQLLLQTTSRDQMTAAIFTLAWPLRWFGLQRDRLAVRIVLILDAMSRVQELVVDSRNSVGGLKRKGSLSRIGHTTANLFQNVIDSAEQEPCEVVQVEQVRRPPLIQWMIPALIAASYSLLGSAAAFLY